MGLALNTAAAVGLLLLDRRAEGIPEVAFAAVTFVIGAGMGLATLAFILGVQDSVGWEQRGIATASLQFVRTLGGLVWVALMGAVMNRTLALRLQALPELGVRTATDAAAFASDLLNPARWVTLPPATLEAARQALAAALRDVHWLVLVCAAAALAVGWLLPDMRFAGQPSAAASAAERQGSEPRAPIGAGGSSPVSDTLHQSD